MNRFINRSLQSAITCPYVFIELRNMTKFYEVSKVLDKRTDAHGRVQFPVRWPFEFNDLLIKRCDS